MLNALVTLASLLALAVAAGAMWGTLSGNRHKVMAALKGRSLAAEPEISTRPVTVRYAPRPAPLRVAVRPAGQWRVAA